MSSQLPHELCFCYRFNLHKLIGMNIDDNDFSSIARIYGVKQEHIETCEKEIQARIDSAVEEIGSRKSYAPGKAPSTYLALGDSITSDRQSYAKIIKKLWYGGPGKEVIDAGISGHTTTDIINRFYEDVLNREFDLISVLIGTNDARGLGDGSGITNVGIDDYAHKLDFIVGKLRETNSDIINITIPPVDNDRLSAFFGTESNWRYSKNHIEKVNEVIREVSQKYSTILVDLAAEIGSRGNEYIDNDGLHLNIDGQILLTEMLLEILSSKT